MTYQRLKEIGNALLVLLIPCLFIGGCIYFVIRDAKENKPYNEKWCSAIQYFDKSKAKFTYQYNQSTFLDDSLVNFTSPDGKVWWAKDFADVDHRKNEDGVEYDDVTLKDGTRYKVYQISEGGCKSIAVEDSLYNKLTEDDQPDDSN